MRKRESAPPARTLRSVKAALLLASLSLSRILRVIPNRPRGDTGVDPVLSVECASQVLAAYGC